MSASEFKQAISELLERARQEGELDPYVGKRHWKRYRYGTRLEVTRDPAVFASSWYATTHNVSGGGIGFWSKQAFSLGDPLFVRERCAGKPGPWLPGHVRYCTLGVSGYLVGVSFDQPGDRDAGWTASSCKPVELPSSSCDRARVSYLCSSLRNRSGLVAVLVSLIVYFGTVSLCRQNLSDPSDLAVVVAGAIAVTMMSFGMGWLFMSRESAVLVAIRRAADELSSGSLDSSPLPETSTREVAAVRQVILDLGIRWRQQAE
ncbi:MAG TPA: PilZ domain-containing protein, partial [Phycisphaerae bacterium]|nr:PilZ domain-containing protein [Phycisphaerae bacterium]